MAEIILLNPEIVNIVAYLISIKKQEFHDGAPMGGGAEVEDRDTANLWWKNTGINPNEIIPVSADPIGGSQGWYDTVVTVSPVQHGEKFGDVQVDNKKHYEFYQETLRYAYTGDKHREMRPEVKVTKLPPPGTQ